MKSMMIRKRLTMVFTYGILILLAGYTLFPLIFLLINSFKGQSDIVSKPLAFPSTLDFSYVLNAADKVNLVQSFTITLFITVAAVGLLVLVSSLTAWVMVRNKSKFSNILFLSFTAAMLIPFQSVMYPLISLMEKLGLKNMGGLIFMYGGFGLSLSVFLYHGFLKSVPISLEEAAVIDGANIFQLFFKVVFPLVKATTVTVIILNSMWIWNDYLLPFLIIGDSSTKTLTLSLYYVKQLAGQYGAPWETIFPAVLVSIFPIIILFISLQKHIVKGVSDGAVKG